MFQNANLSIRVSDQFMQAVENGETGRRTGSPIPSARSDVSGLQLMREIAEGTWYCGDPGLQYETTINNWRTCKSGPISASNPCSGTCSSTIRPATSPTSTSRRCSVRMGRSTSSGSAAPCAIYLGSGNPG
ncbi:MAG: hypothetical protein U0992_22055 [Planctomycetaceae bacterium]